MNTKILILINLIVFFFGIDVLILKHKQDNAKTIVEETYSYIPIIEEPVLEPINYEIADPVPSFLNYDELVSKLEEWNETAPELTELFTYGSSSEGKDLYCIRVNNKRIEETKPVLLITAATHGNEPWSCTSVMGYIGTILDKYGDDKQITDLIDSRDIYFVPIVSPDSYPHSRYVDGVDPNRDYPTRRNPSQSSIKPIEHLKQLFLEKRPSAAISGHTYGRVYLYPWGDSTKLCPNDLDYVRILKEMERYSGYGYKRACYAYNRPIFGTEVDWYYMNGCFSIVMEFGSHQRPPTNQEVQSEFDRTFEAVLYFCEEAPLVEIN